MSCKRPKHIRYGATRLHDVMELTCGGEFGAGGDEFRELIFLGVFLPHCLLFDDLQIAITTLYTILSLLNFKPTCSCTLFLKYQRFCRKSVTRV